MSSPSGDSSRSRKLAILGSTGSIGTSTLAVVQALPGRFAVHGLAAGKSWEALADQVRRWRPKLAALGHHESASRLQEALGAGSGTEVLSGTEGLVALATDPEVDVVVSAIVGAAGVEPTLAALRAGKTVALANKEALVTAGELMMAAARESGAALLALDSEHSALFQAMRSGARREVRKVILTASGGPFRTATWREMTNATVEQALNHPTWRMGPKITVDSATLMNKALEIIEARWLFDLEPHQIEVLIHPQSIVHGIVEFVDGSQIAQLGIPDMKLPIQYALTYPERVDGGVPATKLTALGRLEFTAPDPERFPSLRLAYRALAAGGTMPAVLNAANEAAVSHFLAGEIPLTEIFTAVETAMDAHEARDGRRDSGCGTQPPQPEARLLEPSAWDAVLAADRWARQHVEGLYV